MESEGLVSFAGGCEVRRSDVRVRCDVCLSMCLLSDSLEKNV